MAKARKTNATTVCDKCGAAMVIVRVEPSPDEANVELHLFRCEICGESASFKFESMPRKER